MSFKFRYLFPYALMALGVFFYLYIFNKYHLLHAEQMQLFRYDSSYVINLMDKPGGLSTIIARFIIQFFAFPLPAIILMILIASLLIFLLKKTFAAFNQNYRFIWVLPVFLIILLQSNHNYHLETTIAFILILSLFLLYITLKDKLSRNIAVIALPSLAFITAGGLWMLLLTIIILYEIVKSHFKSFNRLIFLCVGVVCPFLICRFIYTCPPNMIWDACISFHSLHSIHLISLIILLLYVPFCVMAISRIQALMNKSVFLITGITGICIWGYFGYDLKTEKLFGIEYFFREQNYAKVVELVENYPGNDHLVIYLGNIALSNTGQMGDKLFGFRQVFGPKGLYMNNEPVNIATLYGSELYQNLKYTNEACHWAFNGLLINGENPNILKQLIKYELVNGNYEIAKKYIRILSRTLLYKDWAVKYYKFAVNPLLILTDDELADLRKFSAIGDFYHDQFDFQLRSLISQYPDNRPAFDYLVSNSLLKKDLKTFMDQLSFIREFKMNRLPVHYEEALLVCKTIFPELDKEVGKFDISIETRQRFEKYIALYESAQGNPQIAYKKVFRDFRFTYWFYLDFFADFSAETELNVQLFPY